MSDRRPQRDSSLGPFWDGEATEFVLPAPRAERVELRLFADDRRTETGRHDLAAIGGGRWRARLEGIGPGQLYGYRVHGPFAPERGDRFDPSKLLIDPAARAVSGAVTWSSALTRPDSDTQSRDRRDSAAYMPMSRVVAPPSRSPRADRPEIPWRETVLYECHVRGATKRHPEIEPALRGTYLGLVEEPFLEHLHGLGITTLQLMPVHHFTPERHLAVTGRTNYWGYSPLAFYAPHAGYATGDDGRQVDEFRTMVRRLHAAGIEVLIDVVLNHTAEGDRGGPTLSLRGLDNRTFYRLDGVGTYRDFTGCGHTLDFGEPTVVALAVDCLRAWMLELGVDGFRFDLAPVLGRGEDGAFASGAPFFEALDADPLLRSAKLIAEPWDLGPDGYQLGRFPAPWCEWSDRFRDSARSFWRGDTDRIEELQTALAGSRDLFPETDGRRPVHYVVSHDGFTLHDLVSYEERHNLANGEENRDGHRHNLSRNWGVEGETNDPAILALRRRAQLNLLASVMLTSGIPMLAHGDEIDRTQLGNNNAYCQDGPLTWIDWELTPAAEALQAFCRSLADLRRQLLAAVPDLAWEPFEGDVEPADETPIRLWIPAGGLLLVLHAGVKRLSIELPKAAQKWNLTWSTAERPKPPRAGHLRVEARSATLVTRAAAPIGSATRS